MTLDLLKDTPSCEWPSSARDAIRGALRDPHSADRLLATQLAGDLGVINDELADDLLTVARAPEEPQDLRERAALAFGPVLEHTDSDGFDSINEVTFNAIQSTLRAVYRDRQAPKSVRRRALEASVRAPQAWHAGAVRDAWSSADDEWKTTAVFAMRYVPGFDREIRKALADPNPAIRVEAVRAAGVREIAPAWPKLKALLTSPPTDRDLFLAAIEAAPLVNPAKAQPILTELAEDPDQEFADAASDALTLVESDEPVRRT